jgi:hypothetical protein
MTLFVQYFIPCKQFYLFHQKMFKIKKIYTILNHLNYLTYLQSISSSSILNLSSQILILALTDIYTFSVYRCTCIYISLTCARHPGHRTPLERNTLQNRTHFFLNVKLHH